MKKLLMTIGLVASTNMLMAGESSFDLPSSIPIEVFKMKDNQRAFGYIGFNVDIDQRDDYYNDKIGVAAFKTHGLIYTEPKSVDTFLGNMFELSYTAGMINSSLKKNIFTDNGKTYDNTFDKKGFYIGIRPAFNYELYSNKWFILKNSTALHTFLFNLKGDFSVNTNTNNYAYDEEDYGIGLKPSSVLQLTAYPTNHLGVSLFGGVTTFVAASYIKYDNKVNANDSDSESAFVNTGINAIYGYDITYNFFGKYKLGLSSALTKQGDEDPLETIIRYTHTF